MQLHTDTCNKQRRREFGRHVSFGVDKYGYRLMVSNNRLWVGNPARKLVLLKLADNANDDEICFSYQYMPINAE